MNYKELYQSCEAHIRRGNAELAAQQLHLLTLSKVPGVWRFRLANLCRRAGLTTLGIKILTPQITMDREEWIRTVSPAEVAEYALLLQRNGSVNEALQILNRVNAESFPDALLYRAYCHFNRWEYAAAIPLLQAYVTSPLEHYKLLVGRLNLAAAFVSVGDCDQADALLNDLLRISQGENHARIMANCHELRAQMALNESDLKQAKICIEASAKILSSARTLDQLFVRKLQVITEALESGSTASLDAFRSEAASRMDWESVRDIDLFQLKHWFEPSRFDHLIFGTPFAAYRERACRTLQREPANQIFIYGAFGQRCMDVLTGQIDGGSTLTVGGKVHQLIEILLRDFYRPKSLGALFSELFPAEHFDIFSSADRVHQILRRARMWIRESSLPIRIKEVHRNYAIEVCGDFCFRLTLEREPVSWNEIQLRRLKAAAGSDHVYGANELRQKLGMGLAPFRRFTGWALESGKIQRSGLGKATTYRLAG